MERTGAPWVRGRGLERLLAQETNVSDLIQFLSDRDPTPWEPLVGFVPDDLVREASAANNADLLLTAGSKSAVIEVKLGHLMPAQQQAKYEALEPDLDLYLAALSADEVRLAEVSDRWKFLSLSSLFSGWESSQDELARSLAREAAALLKEWDRIISGVLEAGAAQGGLQLDELKQKFLARVVTRRLVKELHGRGHMATAGVTSGGGLPIIKAWAPIRGEGKDRTFMAEVRWRDNKPGGELRFGVDFDPRPGHKEDEEVRRAAYDLAHSMEHNIDHKALHARLTQDRSDLGEALSRGKSSRPAARGDWEAVIVHGLKGSPVKDGGRNTRRRTTPAFYGDGALRFQAISDIDFSRVSAQDLVDLIDLTLNHLSSSEPEQSTS